MNDAVNEKMILSQNKGDMIAIYIFFLLGILGFLVFPLAGPIIGIIIASKKRNDVVGTYYYSHLNWLVRTFWVTLIADIIGFFLIILFIGIPILYLSYCWFIFRVIYGFVQLLNKQPVNDQSYFM